MSEGFVRASRLYDVDSRTPIAHPAHQATDADVRAALEQKQEIADTLSTRVTEFDVATEIDVDHQ